MTPPTGSLFDMLMTSWLCLLHPGEPRTSRTAPRTASRHDPRRHAETAWRSNPFVPPERVRADRPCRTRPTEHRWLVRQRRP